MKTSSPTPSVEEGSMIFRQGCCNFPEKKRAQGKEKHKISAAVVQLQELHLLVAKVMQIRTSLSLHNSPTSTKESQTSKLGKSPKFAIVLFRLIRIVFLQCILG